MTFWDHLEVLRKVILRALAIVLVAAVLCFCFKELMFRVILAPSKPDFVLYRLLAAGASALGLDASGLTDFSVSLFSATLTAQFMVHLKTAFYVGLIIAMPYVLMQLYGFVAPALLEKEKRYTTRVVLWSYILFMTGVLLDYFIIFPLAFRFLGTYQVSTDVPNVITLTSYIEMLLTMTLLMGILFELPILSWFLAKLGVLNSDFMKQYRRHAFVIIVFVGALITPTTDIFTLMVVSLPIYLLYEVSIRLVRKVNLARRTEAVPDTAAGQEDPQH